MASDKQNSEPSMEEILASIRRIISEESDGQEPTPGGGDDGVLELTQVVEDAAPKAEATKPAPVSEPEPPPAPAAPEPTPEMGASERLVSDLAATMASSRFSALARAAEPDPLEGMRGGRTVEEIVVDLLKPMLKEWLDSNLPSIVERMVEREIRYLSRRNDSE
jgi:hypothetical protein